MGMKNLAALGAGFALDLILGDPPNWPHPVRLMGKQIDFEEGLIRKYLLPECEREAWPLDRAQSEQLAGAALALDVMTITPLATWGLLKLLNRVHPALSFTAEAFICYQLLATRALRDASMAVHDKLVAGDVDAARAEVAMIVGRDTDQLDEQGIARAAVETVAENASDGVLAPMLFAAAGGAPAMMLYKAVNTLDSMVGYRNERYLNLGRASARIDDVFNYVPSRLSGLLMCAAAPIVGLDGERAWKVFKRDRRNHLSPNSAQSEAACAGALGVQLGGPNYYGGKLVDKPAIGDDTRPIEAEDIKRANKLMYAMAATGLVLCGCVTVLLRGTKRGNKK